MINNMLLTLLNVICFFFLVAFSTLEQAHNSLSLSCSGKLLGTCRPNALPTELLSWHCNLWP